MVIAQSKNRFFSFHITKPQVLSWFCLILIFLTVVYLGENHKELVPVVRRVLRYFFDIAVFMAPQLVEYYMLRIVIITSLILTAIASVITGMQHNQVFASTGINQTINFQGKVANSDGTNVANGLYTFVFKLYDASSGGSNPWTETQNNVQVTAGIFRVALGSVTPFTGVDFNTDNLYLGVNFNSDGEMTPRIRFAATPYALNAQKVAGLTVTDTTGTLTIPNLKTVQFGGGFSTDANDINLSTSGTTSLTLPVTGTLATLDGSENLSNKTFLTSLVVSGVSTDITTGVDEALTLTPNGTGNVVINPQAGGQAALVIDNQGLGDIFTASSSGATKFTLKNDGSIYGPAWNIQATGSASMTAWEGGGLSSDCSSSGQKLKWDASTKQFNCGTDLVSSGGTGADLLQGTADLGNITIANSTTYLNTVSVTPSTTTADILVNANLWTRSLSNTDQTITVEIRVANASACTGTLLSSGASTLVGSSGQNGPAVFATYVETNPGITTKSYDICAYSSVNNGAAAGGLASAVAIDSGSSNGISSWTYDQNAVLSSVISSLDLVLGGTSTESSKFAVIGMAGTNTPVASISAQNGQGQALVLGGDGTIQAVRNNSLFVGGGETGDLVLGQSSHNVLLPGFDCSGSGNGGKLTTTLGGVLTCAADVSGGGSGSSNWNLSDTDGTIFPVNSTLDFLIGATATESAKFGILNIAGGVPIATISAPLSGNALSFDAGGNIQTSNAQPLKLGGGDSGEVYVSSLLHIDSTMGVRGGGLSDCSSATTAKLLWDASTNRFSCGTDQGGGGGSSMTVRESDSAPAVSAVAVLEFGPDTTSSDEFIVTDQGSNVARLRIGNQVAILNQDESVTGNWIFSGNINSGTDQNLNFNPNGSGNIIFNTDNNSFIGIGTTTPLASLDVRSSEGTTAIASISGSTSFAGLVVDNSGSGDLLTASTAGLTRFTVTNSGTASLSAGLTGSTTISPNGVIATTAKQSLQLGDVNTGNVQVGIGGSSNPNLLVLDGKNDNSSDPAGVNGAMYYNNTLDTFRCFKSGSWQNCGADVNKQQYAKSSDQSVTNSNTLTDESALQVTMGAGETWIFQYFLLVSNNSSAGPDWKAAILASTASACDVTQSGAEPSGAAFPQATTSDCTTPGSLANTAINASSLPFQVYIQGAVTDNGSGGTIKLQFAENTAGAGTSITVKKGSYVVAYKATGADLAEMYYSNDRSIGPGDVVSIDGNLPAGLKKSTSAYDKNVLGIVSTQPGLVLGDGSQIEGMPVYLALSGRVPVKVSTESGEIKPGDYLTSSSTPGVGMKAVGAGRIIGQALTGTQNNGTVLAFINNGFAPENIATETTDLRSLSGLRFDSNQTSTSSSHLASVLGVMSSRLDSLESFENNIKKSQLFESLSLNATNSAIFENGLTSFGPSTFGQLSVMESLSIGSLSIQQESINNLGTLELQPLAQGNISFMKGKVLIDTDGNMKVSGNAEYENDVVVKGSLQTNRMYVDKIEPTSVTDTEVISSASAGLLTIKNGQPLTLHDVWIDKNSLLYLTPRSELDTPIYISSQSAGMATFKTNTTDKKDIEVNFLIVNLRN